MLQKGFSKEQAKMSRMVSADTCQSQCEVSREEYKILFEEGRKGSEDG